MNERMLPLAPSPLHPQSKRCLSCHRFCLSTIDGISAFLISNKAIMTKLNIDVRAFYYDQDIPQPKMTKGEMAYLLHPSKYPRVQLPRDRRYLYDPYFPVRPLINFFDSLRCYMQTCSTPDSGIDLNEQLDEEKEQKKKKISLAPGPDTVYFAGKHGHLVRRRDEDDDDGDIPHSDSFWLDS